MVNQRETEEDHKGTEGLQEVQVKKQKEKLEGQKEIQQQEKEKKEEMEEQVEIEEQKKKQGEMEQQKKTQEEDTEVQEQYGGAGTKLRKRTIIDGGAEGGWRKTYRRLRCRTKR